MVGLADKLKDILFPKFCAGCEKEGDWLCDQCLPVAGFSYEEKAVPNLDGITALFDYGENAVSKLIKIFKYNYLLEVAGIFKKIVGGAELNYAWPGFTIVPVPLHARRGRERGFNQAEILAGIFSEKLGLPVNAGLRRGIYTAQQAKLSKEERQKNLKDAFAWGDDKAPPEKILLVDDVFTTGATMQECAKVLKNNGVKAVWGLALARG